MAKIMKWQKVEVHYKNYASYMRGECRGWTIELRKLIQFLKKNF